MNDYLLGIHLEAVEMTKLLLETGILKISLLLSYNWHITIGVQYNDSIFTCTANWSPQ